MYPLYPMPPIAGDDGGRGVIMNKAATSHVLPEVGIGYQPCPACGYAAGCKTYKLGKDGRRPVRGSDSEQYTYGTCRRCGLRVRIVFFNDL